MLDFVQDYFSQENLVKIVRDQFSNFNADSLIKAIVMFGTLYFFLP